MKKGRPSIATSTSTTGSDASLSRKSESSVPTKTATAKGDPVRFSLRKKVHPEISSSEPDVRGSLRDATPIRRPTYTGQVPERDKKKRRHHHHEFVKQLLRLATDEESKFRPIRRRKGTLGSNIYRIRDGGNIYKLRKLGSTPGGPVEEPMQDPLLYNNIRKSMSFKTWKRDAHLALPSNIGVPVESSGDALELGASVKEQRKAGSTDKQVYNSLLDDMEKKFSPDGTDGEKRRSSPIISTIRRSLTDLANNEGRRSEELSGAITFIRKLNAIRELPDHMVEKRHYKAELLQQGLEGVDLTNRRAWRDILEMSMIKFHNRIRDNFRMFSPWQNDLRMIHGTYGLGVATYFHWLRTVVCMNIAQTILVILLIVIPELCSSTDSDVILTSCPTQILSVETCALIPSARENPSFTFVELFTGRGVLKNTYLYYSGYKDTLADPQCPSHSLYKHPSSIFYITAFRFFLTMFSMFIINSVFLAVKIKQYYQTAELESKIPGLHKKQRFRTFFSSWDFSVIDPETALVLHRNIWRGFVDAIDQETADATAKKLVPAERPFLEQKLEAMWGYNTAVIVVHVLMTTLLMVTYTLAGYIMWWSLASRMMHKKAGRSKDACNEFAGIPDALLVLPSLVMSVLYLGVGFFSAFIAQFESWGSAVNKNFAFIIRVGIYYCMTIGVVYGYFMYQAKESIKGLLCYEDFFGHEIYRLIVLQGFIYITVTFIAYNIYSLITRWKSGLKKPQFDPVNYTLRAFYLHTISGIGFFYCPLVSLLILVRQIITFYHHKRMLKHFYRLSTHIIQSSDVYPPFLLAYLLSYLATTAMNLALFEFHPSTVCGPFSQYNEALQIATSTTDYAHYYQMFVDGLANSNHVFIRALVSPGFAFVFIVFLLAVVYTLRWWGQGYLVTIEEFYHLLRVERKDRDFLLEAIYHFAKRTSKEQEMAARIDGKWAEVDEGGNPYKEETMVEGIFKHRRGTLATLIDLAPLQRESGVALVTESAKDKLPEAHGTIGNQIKEEFDWLPSQWRRRGRRPGIVPEGVITYKEVSNFQQIYRQALTRGMDVKEVDSNASAIIKTHETKSDQVKSKNKKA